MCRISAFTTFVRFLTYRRETRQALVIRDNVMVDLDVGCKKVSEFLFGTHHANITFLGPFHTKRKRFSCSYFIILLM